MSTKEKATAAIYWSWPTLLDRGWTNDLYRKLLRGPDRTPRGLGHIKGERGTWGFLKSRVLTAEDTDAFKKAMKDTRAEQRKKRKMVEEQMAKADGYAYVVIVRHMEENPREHLNTLLGPDGWQRIARYPWCDSRACHVYLIRDDTRMVALRLSHVSESIVSYRKLADAKARVLKTTGFE